MAIVYIVLYLYVFWLFYLAIMSLYHARKTISKFTWWLGMPAIGVGFTIDFVTNMTLAFVLFLDRPHEMLVTQRLKRYIQTDTGWRKKLAQLICSNLLDPFDIGGHCK